ncbi:hypothetical protein [Streptomyces sp. x-19]|uniref:hypothetical protein n=1 Tax=Streptomyces sp. x-19 TaxID=2789280 RepID=UPI0039809171
MHENDESISPELDSGLCDLCGRTIPPSMRIFSLAPDSSVIHPDDPHQDGQRLLVACSAEHLGELQQQYRQRPYLKEELWAGKITRALRAHPEGLDEAGLVQATGLNIIQIEHTLSWESERFLLQQTHPVDPDRPEGDRASDDTDRSDGEPFPGDEPFSEPL